jgi:putative Mg2+ transporter-C (MgtC) family protein
MMLALVRGLDASVSDQLELVGLIALAVILGAVIGAERELANKSAGLRTHALVAAGSALAVAIGHILYESALDDGIAAGDPGRALHAVLTGIGFIGAGAIIRQRTASVEGLTTAASLWFAAGVGIATGLGLFVVAAGATVVGLAVLSLMRQVDASLRRATGRALPERGRDGPSPDG